MAETWLPFATRKDGPATKQGYPGSPRRTSIDGIVGHSMEGSLAAALGELMNPARQASWTLSNPKAGPLLQHYPIESITWASGGVVANTRFLAIESEGVAGELLNPNQIKNMQDLMNALPLSPWVRKVNVFEHRECVQFGSAPTACPSNRYPWAQIISGLEDDMTPEELKQACIAALREPLPELNNRSVVTFLNESDDYILRSLANTLKAAEAELRKHAP